MNGSPAPLLDIYFDYRSPFAYVAAEVMPAFAERNGLEIRWQPTDIGRLENYARGLHYTEIKRRYTAIDAARTAAYHGVKIRMPKPHPVESATALGLALVASGDPRFGLLHQTLFRAAWRDQQDLATESVLRACIEHAGGPADEWLAAAREDRVGEALARVAAEAEAAGVFGVPAMFFGGEQYWGVDSLPLLEWRIGQARLPG